MGNVSSLNDIGIVCNCGHEESEHTPYGFCNHIEKESYLADTEYAPVMGSTVEYDKKCDCNGYNQTKLRKRGELDNAKR